MREEKPARRVLDETVKGLDPRLRVAFLLTAAVGIFFLRTPVAVSLACACLAIVWLVVQLPPHRLFRQVVKLWGFAAFVLISYAFFPNDPGTDRWALVPVFGTDVRVNTSGLFEGGVMVLRVLAIILASQIARAGDVRAIASGLRRLGMSRSAAITIDTVFALFGDGDGGGGRMGGGGGHGTGGGRGRGRGQGGGHGGSGERHGGSRGGAADQSPAGIPTPAPVGFWASVRRMARGDVGPIVERIEHQIRRAERHVSDHASSAADGAERDTRIEVRDVAIIAGIALTMLGVRALKILPSIPFAPGHKLVVLTPLYVAAGLLTRGRFGATLTGATMGTVAFLMGDGKYGIFEILKHVTPGIICDLFLPMLTARGRRPGGIVWSLFGGVIAAGRFATIFAITFLVQAPAVAFAILVPGLLIHVTFGIASGWVTYHIVRNIHSKSEDPLQRPGAAPDALAANARSAPDPSIDDGKEPSKTATPEIAKEPA